jgi:hypothetical protein
MVALTVVDLTEMFNGAFVIGQCGLKPNARSGSVRLTNSKRSQNEEPGPIERATVPLLSKIATVLVSVKAAARRLRRLPKANLDLPCARRTFGR